MASVAVLLDDIHASLKQQVDHPLVAVAGGVHRHGAAVECLLVDLRAALQQQVDHPLVAFVGGDRQRGVAVAIPQVDLCAVQKQQLDHLLLALLGGKHQRGDAAHIVYRASRVDPPAAVKPRQQRRLLASLSRLPGLFGKAAR